METSRRSTYIIAFVSFIILVLALYFLFIFQRGAKEPKIKETADEVKYLSEINISLRPYVTLTPTSDGAEIIISIENLSNFDRIEYELTYLADNPTVAGTKIQRGSTGTDVNTKEQKYKKSILLGTASRGVRIPDTGITDGKLTMHLFKDSSEYLSETSWDLVQAGTRTTLLENTQGSFKLNIGSLNKNYWIILTETIGLPPSFNFKAENVFLPIWGAFSIAPRFSQRADLAIKLDKEVKNAQLHGYFPPESKWQKLESNIDDSSGSITAKVDSFGTFVVVSSQ